MRSYVWGPLTRFGLTAAGVACLLDQASKLYLLKVFDLAVKAAAVLLLWVWLAHARDRLSALALGLIVGGALGNAIDRLAYGWVADFVHFHITAATWRFSWYVFNLADVAIVAGVIALLYDSIWGDSAAKAP